MSLSFLRIWLLAAGAAVLGVAGQGTQPTSRPDCPMEGVTGEAAFREGLRRRGMTGLLEQYLADQPPVNQADEKLRRRESLLARAADPQLPADRRRELVGEARALLEEVLTGDPPPGGRLALMLELARDDLERLDPPGFDAALLFELPGRDRRRAATLAGRASATLASLQKEIAATWAALEELDEEGITRLNAGGMTVLLESIQADAACLQCWAGLFEALASPSPSQDQRPALERLLEQTAPAMEAPEPPPGRERLHCRQLLVAAVAARLLGRFEQADACARQVVAVAGRIRSPAERQAVRTLVLAAVLEQLRAARDAGRFDQLRSSIEQVRSWLQKNRPQEAAAWLGLAWIESTAAAATAVPSQSTPAEPAPDRFSLAGRLDREEALAPLEAFAARSPAWRDGLYAAFAGAVQLPSSGRLSGFRLQLTAGAVLAEAAEDRVAPPEMLVEALADASDGPAGGLLAGERLFLLARAHYLAGRRLEAVEALARLLEEVPGHDRGPAAAQEAVTLAGELLGQAGDSPSPRVLQAFIRAIRGLRGLRPEAPLAPGLQFRLAAAVERSADPESAEKEYAAVATDDPFALPAALGRLRCWMTLLQQAAAGGAHADGGTTALAARAVQAGEEAGAAAMAAMRDDDSAARCTAALVAASWAAMLNHPLVARADRALEVLQGFESRFAGCAEALGWALRERVRALEAMNRLPEARAVVEQYLEADPRAAGPVMARLLASMRREVRAALERDQTDAAVGLAGEAALLAGRLWDWADAHPEGMSAAERSALLEARGWALRLARRPVEALQAYDACVAALATMPAGEPGWLTFVQLGRAECLLDLDRPAEALPLFLEAWRRLPERGDDWWRALTGSLASHLALGTEPDAIVQTVRQQRGLSPDLGGPWWKRLLDRIERQAAGRAAGGPASSPAAGG